MLTAIVILLVILAVVAIIGGVSMMMNSNGCFFSWYMGFHAVQAGFEIIGYVIAAIARGALEG